MGQKKKTGNIWEKKAQGEDYQAAHQYLSLLFSETDTRKLVGRLRKASPVRREAKDILRASQTRLLGKHNSRVAENLKKIKKDEKLSPVLLIRGDGKSGKNLIIADGHHRICASWHWNEDLPVACCIISLR